MKKLIAIFISLIIIFSLVACSNQTVPTTENNVNVSDPDFSEVVQAFRNGNTSEYDDFWMDEGYLYQISTPIGSIHSFGFDLAGITVFRDNYCEVVFDRETGTIYYYTKGLVRPISVPDADFCGVNRSLQSIVCRIGSDIYLISFESLDKKLIATNVSQVIDCEYSFSSQIDSGYAVTAPLFLMNDGSLQCYIYNELKSPLHEGGYVEIRPLY